MRNQEKLPRGPGVYGGVDKESGGILGAPNQLSILITAKNFG